MSTEATEKRDYSSLNYMRIQDEEHFSFNIGYHQIWASGKAPTVKRASNESVVLSYFGNFSSEEQDIILNILMNIKDFGFLTESQIVSILTVNQLEAELVPSIIVKLVKLNFINFFLLGDSVAEGIIKEHEIPEDALKIYCIDVAGNKILFALEGSHHTTWLPKDTRKLDVGIIMKQLTTVQYQLNLFRFKGEQLLEFTPCVDFEIGNRQIRCSARIAIAEQGRKKEFILESVRNEDVPPKWRKKVETQLKPLSRPNEKTGKYDFYRNACFYDIPKLIILAEDESKLIDIADIYFKMTGNKDFFMTTDAEISDLSKEPRYWKFIPPTEETLENDEFAMGEIKAGKIPTFSRKTE